MTRSTDAPELAEVEVRTACKQWSAGGLDDAPVVLVAYACPQNLGGLRSMGIELGLGRFAATTVEWGMPAQW
ncbi:MAG TPA: hypothetical protein PLF40_29195 [Kofleriaceae bacterium]|nr:hypothetical protein [Kofleriaceae bacterium]